MYIFFITNLIIGCFLSINRSKTIKNLLLGIFVLVNALFTLYLIKNIGLKETFFNSDPLSVIFTTILFIISTISIFHSYPYLRWQQKKEREHNFYFAAMVILVTALNAAYSANHIAITWVFVEITTISASFLIYYRRTELTLEATWKYIFVCSISVTFIFIGILFLSISMKNSAASEMTYDILMEKAHTFDPFWLKMAFIFIFTGFTAKAGLFPMYTAGIDAKDKAPSPAGAIFASGVMNVGLCGIIRTYAIIHRTEILSWSKTVLTISALISIFIASVYIMKVLNFKRMLAYSSVEHMGIITLGLAMGGPGIFAALFHSINHSLIKPALFYQSGIFYRVFGSKFINETGGFIKYSISGSLVFLFGYLLAIAVPPSGLFISEFIIFKEMFIQGKFLLMVAVMILITVIIWALGRNILKATFIPISGDDRALEKPSFIESFPQLCLILCVALMGTYPPQSILKLLEEVVSMVIG